MDLAPSAEVLLRHLAAFYRRNGHLPTSLTEAQLGSAWNPPDPAALNFGLNLLVAHGVLEPRGSEYSVTLVGMRYIGDLAKSSVTN